MQKFPMTVQGEHALRVELDDLKSVQRPTVIASIAEARWSVGHAGTCPEPARPRIPDPDGSFRHRAPRGGASCAARSGGERCATQPREPPVMSCRRPRGR